MSQLLQADPSLLGDNSAAKGANLRSRGLGGAGDGQQQLIQGYAAGQLVQEPSRASGGGAGPWSQTVWVQTLLNLLSL